MFGQIGTTGATLRFLHADGHGSTRLLSDAAATVAAAFGYDAFGSPLGFDPAAAGTIYLFGGDGVYDAASGLTLHGNGVRTRRDFLFLQRDPYAGDRQDPLSLHKYLYVHANPVTYTDPSGYFFFGDVLSSIGLENSLREMSMEVYSSIYDAVDASLMALATGQSVEQALDAMGWNQAAGFGIAGVLGMAGTGVLRFGKSVRSAFDRHHPLPKSLGGHTRQVLKKLTRNVHSEFHSLLSDMLAKAGFPLRVGGRNGSVADWANYLQTNPGRQWDAFMVVLDASREIDARHGTSIVKDVWQNLLAGNYNRY